MSLDQNPRNVDKLPGAPRGGGDQAALTEAKLADNTDQSGRKSLVREYAEAIIVAMLLAFAIRVFVVQAFKIPSGSMIPTLQIGDHILVSKLSYGLQWPTDCKVLWSFPPLNCYTSETVVTFGKPQRGDIIVFRFPEDEEKDFIKRIVGLPGDTVQLKNKSVLVNGQPLDDKAFTQRIDPGVIDGTINPRDNFGPVTVPEGSYFVMGDNRDQSLDSRFWGYVREEKIRGRAFRIYWSWNGQGNWTEWVRWERFGKAIQ
ncbi:MAG: signal peptidase I [Nitrospira sp.]|jgi:signal peptidase I|nr:MAG: signal peptidase I [Nitrospira sp.]